MKHLHNVTIIHFLHFFSSKTFLNISNTEDFLTLLVKYEGVVRHLISCWSYSGNRIIALKELPLDSRVEIFKEYI